jgi:hypothetical protein
MHAEQKKFLDQHHRTSEWHGRSENRSQMLKGFAFDGSELRGWTLERVLRDEIARTVAIRSLWRRGKSTDELLAVDVFECSSIKAAHDQVLEALSNVESNAIERQPGKIAFGDVTFALGETMVLFARANMVVWVRNAGLKVVAVNQVARTLDSVLSRRLKSLQKR